VAQARMFNALCALGAIREIKEVMADDGERLGCFGLLTASLF